MLSIGRLRPGGAEYYVGEIATSAEDYYLGHGEAPGRWVGSLAADLGLEGQVDPDHFRRLLEGRHPFTGEQLVGGHRSDAAEPYVSDGRDGWLSTIEAGSQLRCSERYVRRLLRHGVLAAEKAVSEATGRIGWRVRRSELNRYAAEHHRPKSRPGFDVTLRPPKSVSVLWALGDEHQRALIRDAHREAVDEVVRYLEGQAIFARSKGDRVLTRGLVAAAFDHRTSRAGDPLLHTHVVVTNLTFTALDTWRALDGRPLYDHALSGGHLYQAHLRHLLSQRLGVRWSPVHNGWAEIVGVPNDVITEFSQRRDEIEALLAESGYSSARARQAATLASRAAKDYGVAPDILVRQWRDRATEAGFDDDAVQACFGHESPTPFTREEVEAALDRAGGSRGVTEQRSTFTRRDAIKWLANNCADRMHAAEIERAADRFLGSGRVVPLLPTGGHRRQHAIGSEGTVVRTAGLALFSTPELLAIEEHVLTVAAEGAGYHAPTADGHHIDAALAARPELSDEQRAMVRAVCESTTTVQPIVGRPGSGKTYAAEACAAALLASGVSVVGCSVSATAAAELERSTGVASTTIAGLLNQLGDPRFGGFPDRGVLLVDEASMVGTRDLARLLEHVARARGSLKLIGDPDQHTAVDTGGVFRYLASHTPDAVMLVENNRQVEADERLAIADYREGRIADALARYDDAGKVVRCATAGECHDAMVADWYAGRLHGESDPMIAGPNSTQRALNARARALLKAEGALSGPPLLVAGSEFMVGDEVIARRNDRTLRAPGRRAFVKNGSVGTITEVDVQSRELLVAFDREGTVRLPARYLDDGHLEHAYARTTYLVQGATHQTGRYHPTDASRFEEGYVALTRARHQTRIYVVEGEVDLTDDTGLHAVEPERPSLDTVADAMANRGSKATAHEVDPRAAAVAQVLSTTTSTDIRARIRELERILAASPPSRGSEVTAARRKRDALLNARPDVKARTWYSTRLRVYEHQLAEFEAEHAAHKQFVADHAPEQMECSLLAQAQVAMRLQHRLTTSIEPSVTIERLLGARPHGTSVSACQWDEAAEFARNHWASTDWQPSEGARTIDEFLGPRPSDWATRQRYERVELLYENAHEIDQGAGIDMP
ncbi:MAG: relaxase domain-containing protein [Actinobacteria bacterium]|nr:relaxase domain-containing protein [Actinomycetota bacterium]